MNGDSSDRNEAGTDRAVTVNRDSSVRNETGTGSADCEWGQQ